MAPTSFRRNRDTARRWSRRRSPDTPIPTVRTGQLSTHAPPQCEAAPMIIDAHQHVWDLGRAPYPWLGPQHPEWNRTFTFDELAPQLLRNGVGATVLVQSDDHDGDTELMLEVADANPQIAAIVAYLPLDQPEHAAVRL